MIFSELNLKENVTILFLNIHLRVIADIGSKLLKLKIKSTKANYNFVLYLIQYSYL